MSDDANNGEQSKVPKLGLLYHLGNKDRTVNTNRLDSFQEIADSIRAIHGDKYLSIVLSSVNSFNLVRNILQHLRLNEEDFEQLAIKADEVLMVNSSLAVNAMYPDLSPLAAMAKVTELRKDSQALVLASHKIIKPSPTGN